MSRTSLPSASKRMAQVALCAAAVWWLTGCALTPTQPAPAPAPVVTACPPPPELPPPPPPPPAPPVSVIELISKPAEQALLGGIRAYEDGQYAQAEKRLTTALKIGLAAPEDRAAAHKTLAFLYCSSKRPKACEESFRAARAADPDFALTKAEAGHPTWGPVYRRTFATP
jgi:hypothetical protein